MSTEQQMSTEQVPAQELVNLPSQSLVEKTAGNPKDLRVAALANSFAANKTIGADAMASGTCSPMISAHHQQQTQSNQSSPTRVHQTIANTDEVTKEGGITRQNSGSLSLDERRGSRSPTKASQGSLFAPAERQESDAPSGLDFLLQACDMLEPEENTSSRRGAPRRPANRPRRFSNDDEYNPGDSSEDEEYRPSRGAKPSRRSTVSRENSGTLQNQSHGPTATGAPTAKWERGMVHGPCTNPDCEHPEDSPQWRKGPPTNPVLCNACGTRWLRNGTLKPLVPRRGIRYNKARATTRNTNRPRSASNRNSARASAEPSLPFPESSQEDNERMPYSQQYAEDYSQGPPPAAPMVEQHQFALSEQLQAAALIAPALQALQSAPLLQPYLANATTLEQQIAAVTAAARAAQQALVFAAQQQAQHQLEQQQSTTIPTMELKQQPTTARPSFNITAVAGPGTAAPLFKESPFASAPMILY